jgi:hypothetical protein
MRSGQLWDVFSVVAGVVLLTCMAGCDTSRSGGEVLPAPSDFTLTASRQSVALMAGSSTSFNLLATAESGFTGTVAVALSGLPAGVTAGAGWAR